MNGAMVCLLLLLVRTTWQWQEVRGETGGAERVVIELHHSCEYKSDYLVSNAGFRDGLESSTKMADESIFKALRGQGVAMARTDFGPNGFNPPHKHPGALEVLYVMDGTLRVGFVGSNETILEQRLSTGDLFVFPPDIVHYQLNMNSNSSAMAISAFNSSNPGTSQIAY
ncbi:hypothetical protein KP509_24G045300 [Ceratopteris richardii]|nr:hypothetical protein KP509_24G045300 [Ceratopteris richardii]